MNKTCTQCTTSFSVLAEDQDWYDKIDVPTPTLCPDCRQQRRLSFRNERNLYKRSCDFSKKNIISIYAPEADMTVYSPDVWWSDKWDARDYGRDFDFSRPFFEQFAELLRETPLASNMVFHSENAEYNVFCQQAKDIYMSSRIGKAENILYSYLVIDSKDSLDCYNLYHSSNCYECVDCWNCSNCKYSQLCKSSSFLQFCFDCIGCTNCFGCTGLRNKEYYFFNKKYTKEDYEKLVEQYDTKSRKNVESFQQKFQEYCKQEVPHINAVITNSQNAVGDFIVDSKDVHQSFDVEGSEQVRYSWGVEYSKDVMDGDYIYHGENVYEQIANGNGTNIFFTFTALFSSDIWYSIFCVNNSKNCFGCVGMNKKEYCILNKQYTKEEYESLIPKIKEHMKKTGEWGEFFPMSLSPFAYNESLAAENFPLTKEETKKKGLRWKDENIQQLVKQAYEIPDNIDTVEEDLLHEVFTCSCGKHYKVIGQEFILYKKLGIPIPTKCPTCRYTARKGKRNPKKLWKRNCERCEKEIESTYEKKRPEKVYCHDCYLVLTH